MAKSLSLEDRMRAQNNQQETPKRVSSSYEAQLAACLDRYGIQFEYRTPVAVKDSKGLQRLWYPTFFLPEYTVWIQYQGTPGTAEYASRVRERAAAYEENRLESSL